MIEKPIRSSAPSLDRWEPRRISMLAHLLLLLGAATAVFLAGGAQEANLGAFLVVAGVALLVCPPQVRVDWKICALAAALLLSCLLAFLPHGWLPEPEWRQRLIGAAVPLSSSVTPTPRETWFWLGVLAIAVCAALFGLAHPLGSQGQLIVAVAAVVICGVYASVAIYAHQSGWEYRFDPDPEDFGFFLNRNHTANFLVTGSILTLGILGIAIRRRHWFAGSLAAACLAVCITSLIFFSTSRGGIVALLIGALLWLFGIGAAHRSKPLLVSFAAIFVGGILLFLAPQSVVRHRLLTLIGLEKDRVAATKSPADPSAQQAAEAADPSLDGRLLIFGDTLRMIRDFPLTGTGLGTFRYVFPFYREQSLSETPVSHPESDWLMLAAEAGIPALVILAGGIGYLFWRVWPSRRHPSWPLRWGILCAAFAAFLHGFVDVPAHRTALGWWILLLFGIGFQIVPRDAGRPKRSQHLLFVFAGLGACVLGIQLIRAEWFGGPASPPYAAYKAQPEIIRLRLEGEVDEAVEAARQAIRLSPMAERLYFQLGATLLLLEGTEEEADSIFKAQRLVNPNSPDIPIDQGILWINIDPARTAALWLEAIQRRERIEHQQRRGEAGALSLYADLLRRAAEYPDIQRHLLAGTAGRSDFVLAWVERAAPALVTAEIPQLAANANFLEGLSEPGRGRFLQAWYSRGDRENLFRFIQDRPAWQSAAWPIEIRRLIDLGKFEEATRAVAERSGISLSMPAPGSDNAEVRVNDPASAIEAFHASWRKGNTVTAKRILEEARAGPAVPPEIWRLSAALSAGDGKWQAAWQNLERYLRASGRDSLR